jgi:hypothetical protein
MTDTMLSAMENITWDELLARVPYFVPLFRFSFSYFDYYIIIFVLLLDI